MERKIPGPIAPMGIRNLGQVNGLLYVVKISELINYLLYLIFRLAMLNHRKKRETNIAIDVRTAMNMKSGRDTDISSYSSLVLSRGGEPPVVTLHESVGPTQCVI